MKKKIAIVLINLSLGLFSAYMFLLCVRESYISSNRGNIACDIVKLDLRHSSRTHPKAYIIYQNKEYVTDITDDGNNNLKIGFNDTAFFYDEMLDRCFCRNSGAEKGSCISLAIFALSFLFWINPKAGVGDKNNNNREKRQRDI